MKTRTKFSGRPLYGVHFQLWCVYWGVIVIYGVYTHPHLSPINESNFPACFLYCNYMSNRAKIPTHLFDPSQHNLSIFKKRYAAVSKKAGHPLMPSYNPVVKRHSNKHMHNAQPRHHKRTSCDIVTRRI